MKKIRYNQFDYIILGLVFLLAVIFAVGYFIPEKKFKDTIYVRVRVLERTPDIKDEAREMVGREVYFNGTKDPVTLIAVTEDAGKLYLVVRGQGKIEDDRYIFNGTAISVGQPAEIHSVFRAKTVISDVSNEAFSQD